MSQDEEHSKLAVQHEAGALAPPHHLFRSLLFYFIYLIGGGGDE